MNFKQKGKIISYILKLSVLAFTVLPGANRVVLFYIISHVTTTEYFAFFFLCVFLCYSNVYDWWGGCRNCNNQVWF